jgi:hypothetical protein
MPHGVCPVALQPSLVRPQTLFLLQVFPWQHHAPVSYTSDLLPVFLPMDGWSPKAQDICVPSCRLVNIQCGVCAGGPTGVCRMLRGALWDGEVSQVSFHIPVGGRSQNIQEHHR